MKNSLLALLGLILLFTPLVTTAQQSGDFTYTSDGSGITITGYTGPGGPLCIPGSIGGLPVTRIGNDAFLAKGLTFAYMPVSVTSIGDGAFSYCISLTDVMMIGRVNYIGNRAFYGCYNLTNFTIPGGVTNIGDSAFAYCASLTSVAVPSTVTNIGTSAFEYCTGLTNVAIPGGVANIGDSTFDYCTNLTSVTLSNGVTNIGTMAFYYCTSLASVTIPGSVTNIGRSAFTGCANLKEVFFVGNAPAGVQSMFYWRTVYVPVSATIYYLPGTTGWSATVADRPAFLWNPLMQSSGVGPAGFGFNITGTADIPIVVEAATILANAGWVPLQGLNLTNGAFYFSDSNWTNYPARFYRIRSP